MHLYKLSEFSKRINVHPKTLIYWDNTGVLKAKRTITNRRYYEEQQALDYLQYPSVVSEKEVVAYCRVSTKVQEADLFNQEEYIRNFCKNNGIGLNEVILDFGSGLNYKRKGFVELFQRVENKEISKIVITNKDRLVRFGYDWFDLFCSNHECSIVVIDTTEKDVHSELVEDLISIIHVFSCRLYGLRNYKRKTKLEKIVQEEIQNVKP
jgi:predicted site-specific integrase-resolvase